jgi:hypothetical protein
MLGTERRAAIDERRNKNKLQTTHGWAEYGTAGKTKGA